MIERVLYKIHLSTCITCCSIYLSIFNASGIYSSISIISPTPHTLNSPNTLLAVRKLPVSSTNTIDPELQDLTRHFTSTLSFPTDVQATKAGVK